MLDTEQPLHWRRRAMQRTAQRFADALAMGNTSEAVRLRERLELLARDIKQLLEEQ